ARRIPRRLLFLRLNWIVLDCFFFFQAEDGIRDPLVTGVQTCALPISHPRDSASTPKPTALVGMTIRTSSASSTVIPRLFSQRKDRETDRFRLGKTASQK